MSDKYHRYYKHTNFRQNPRGDPKFPVDLTWNAQVQLPTSICTHCQLIRILCELIHAVMVKCYGYKVANL